VKVQEFKSEYYLDDDFRKIKYKPEVMYTYPLVVDIYPYIIECKVYEPIMPEEYLGLDDLIINDYN
jgi:hypothetical protein